MVGGGLLASRRFFYSLVVHFFVKFCLLGSYLPLKTLIFAVFKKSVIFAVDFFKVNGLFETYILPYHRACYVARTQRRRRGG